MDLGKGWAGPRRTILEMPPVLSRLLSLGDLFLPGKASEPYAVGGEKKREEKTFHGKKN